MPSEGLPSPSEVFITGLTGEVNKEDVSRMSEEQQHMMVRFEKTNEMLLNFNMLSAARFEATQQEFKKHTRLLMDMKKDLDSVFKRVRVLKTKIGKQHPGAFKSSNDVFDEEEEEEEENSGADSQASAAAAAPTSSSSTDRNKSGDTDAAASGTSQSKPQPQTTATKVVSEDKPVVQNTTESEPTDNPTT